MPEVLVTIAIVSVLAAIVVPTVTSQISKGDDTSMIENPATLRAAITAFVTDTRKFPGRLQHLVSAPATTDLDLSGTAYGSTITSRWKGPYMSTGLKAVVSTSPIDSISWGLAYAVDSLSDSSYTANNGYIGVTLGGVAANATALRIDSLVDGATGQTAGQLRWALTGGNPTNARLTYLLMGSR